MALVEQLIQKMGLIDEPKILGKTTELLRLLELRSTNVNATINEYAKIVLCVDLAAYFLGVPFDQENALKLSGLRKTHYVNNKRMFEKLLDLNKAVGVSDICIKLGLNELSKKANELLEFYKGIEENDSTDFDISHPQYAAMAVYQACKMNQMKVSKAKIMSFSHLRPSQWTQLEQRWDKVLSNYTEKTAKNTNDKADIKEKDSKDEPQSSGSTKNSNKPAVEDYEVWKRRMLEKAFMELSLKGDTQIIDDDEEDLDDKENIDTES